MLCRIKTCRISASERSVAAPMPQSKQHRIETWSAIRCMGEAWRQRVEGIFDGIPSMLRGGRGGVRRWGGKETEFT